MKSMNLLFVTQKVDVNDPVLGFVHHWLELFAIRFKSVTVVCLEAGEYNLPENVTVRSLGKESVQSRSGLKYWRSRFLFAWKFLSMAFGMRDRDEVVFVHMNPEYVALAGWWWRLKRRTILLWYNHRKGGAILRFAAPWATNILYTSTHAYTARYPHARKFPAGIDTDIFYRNSDIQREPNSVICLGRISPVKKIEIIIDAASILSSRGREFHLHFYGWPEPKDHDYFIAMQYRAQSLSRCGQVTFHRAVTPAVAPTVLNSYEIFISATPRGSFDKAILEAMACETVVVVANESFVQLVPNEFIANEDDAESLALKLEYALSLSQSEKNEYGSNLRVQVVDHHGLKKMIDSVLELC